MTLAVILDMDGLILDTESVYKWAWQKAAAELRFNLDDDFYLTPLGRSNVASEAILTERLGAQFPVVKFRERWSKLWKAGIEDSGLPAKPGLTGLLAFLEQRQIPAAAATSTDRNYTDFTLRAARLQNRFSCIVTGDQIATWSLILPSSLRHLLQALPS